MCNKNNENNRTLAPRLITAVVAACFGSAALANPLNPTVVSGQASFSTHAHTLTVTNTPGAIINWQAFSIGANEATRFVQQSAASTVLNRVTGQDPSSILGNLQSNGRVFLINPNGIVFGAGSKIDVASLVASTLNLSDQDFLASRMRFTDGTGKGSITNQGAITTPSGGQVYLVAPDIRNTGVITAPNGDVLLAAGHTVDLADPANPYLSVSVTAPDTSAVNLGQIITQGGRTGIYAGLITQGGTVSADSAVAGENGKIIFKASKDVTLAAGSVTSANGVTGGQVTVQAETGAAMISGTVSATGSGGKGGDIQLLGSQVGVVNAGVDASGATGGGTVLVGGDYRGLDPAVQNARATYVGSDALIKADALDAGDGGKVIVWSDEATRAYGAISARGGALSGNGGFVETSGGYLDVAGIVLDITAPQGKGGTWLLDPYNITIDSTNTNSTSSGTPLTFTATASPSTVSATSIAGQLDLGIDVVVDTTGGGAEQGNITVNSAIVKGGAGASSLTLKAHNDIVVNAAITSVGGALGVNLTADQDGIGGGAITLNKAINTAGGNVAFNAGGNIQLNYDLGTNINAGSGSVALTSSNGAIQGSPWGAPLDIMANSISLNAASGINAGGAQFYVNAPTISFSNTSGTVRIYNNHAGASSFSGSNTGGNVILESFDSANPTTINSVSAGGDIVFRVNNINIAGPVSAGANTVYLAPFTFNSAASIGGAATFDVAGTELSNISAGKIVFGYDTFGNYVSSATIASAAAQTIANGANLEIWAPTITTGTNALTSNGSLTFKADSMALGGTINVGAGTVNLIGMSYNQAIDLGGIDTAGVLGLSSPELGGITAGTLRIGNATTGNITVSTSVAPTANTLSLNSGLGGISGTGSLSATNLAIRSLDSVLLNGVNAVTNIAASIGGVGYADRNFEFANTGNLNIGSVDGLNGIVSYLSGSNVYPAGTIKLSGSGGFALTQSAGATIGGAAFVADNFGSVLLTEANPTGVIAGNVTGDFVYRSSNPIQISTVGGVAGITTTGKVRLQSDSAGGINQATSANIIAAGLALETAGSAYLNNSGNNVGIVAADLSAGGGSFHLSNTGTLSVGTVTTDHAVTGITTSSRGVNIENTGALSIASAINAGNSAEMVNLDALGAASDLNISANITSGTGALDLSAGQNLVHAGGNISTGGPIWISAAGSFTHSAGAITTSYVGNSIDPDAIGIKADSMIISAPITTGGGGIALNTYTLTQAINVGGADSTGTLGLSTADLGNLSANGGNLYIGDIAGYTGNVQLSGSVNLDPAKFSGLYLGTGGTVADTSGTQLTASTLYVKGDGGVNLSNTTSGHAVGTFGAKSLAGVSFKGSGSYAVDMVDAGTGDASLASVAGSINDFNGIGVNNIVAANLTVTPSSTGNIDLDYLITGTLSQGATSGTVSLRPLGASSVVQSVINTITATTNTATSINTSNTVTTSTTQTVSPIESSAESAASSSSGTAAENDGTSSTENGDKKEKDDNRDGSKNGKPKNEKKPEKC